MACLVAYTVMVAVLRFSHPGKVCSGDFLIDDDHLPLYLVSEGRFQLRLLAGLWFVIAATVAIDILLKRRSKLDFEAPSFLP